MVQYCFCVVFLLTLGPLGPGKPMFPGWPLGPVGPGGPERPSCPAGPWKGKEKVEQNVNNEYHELYRMRLHLELNFGDGMNYRSTSPRVNK